MPDLPIVVDRLVRAMLQAIIPIPRNSRSAPIIRNLGAMPFAMLALTMDLDMCPYMAIMVGIVSDIGVCLALYVFLVAYRNSRAEVRFVSRCGYS